MISVFSFVASCRGKDSGTALFSSRVAERLSERAGEIGETVAYEYVRGDQIHVSFCRGCENCFQNGCCPQDRQDGLAELKRKMLQADILLFCSPVYFGSMSGIAKSVLDRVAYWSHRMELAGKPVGVLVTTSDNHGRQTAEEVQRTMRSMGAAVAYAGYVSRHEGPVNLNQPEQMNPEIDRICSLLLECCRNPVPFIEKKQDLLYAYLNQSCASARKMEELLDIEPRASMRVWQKRGFPQYASLTEYLRSNGPLFPEGAS